MYWLQLAGDWVHAVTDPCLFLFPAPKSIQRRAHVISLRIALHGFVSRPNFICHSLAVNHTPLSSLLNCVDRRRTGV